MLKESELTISTNWLCAHNTHIIHTLRDRCKVFHHTDKGSLYASVQQGLSFAVVMLTFVFIDEGYAGCQRDQSTHNCSSHWIRKTIKCGWSREINSLITGINLQNSAIKTQWSIVNRLASLSPLDSRYCLKSSVSSACWESCDKCM